MSDPVSHLPDPLGPVCAGPLRGGGPRSPLRDVVPATGEAVFVVPVRQWRPPPPRRSPRSPPQAQLDPLQRRLRCRTRHNSLLLVGGCCNSSWLTTIAVCHMLLLFFFLQAQVRQIQARKGRPGTECVNPSSEWHIPYSTNACLRVKLRQHQFCVGTLLAFLPKEDNTLVDIFFNVNIYLDPLLKFSKSQCHQNLWLANETFHQGSIP